MAKRLLVALASTPAALIGCHSSDDGLPSDPPTSVTKVSSSGFQSPTDAVASPDGRTFYFAAWDDQKQPTVFQVSSVPDSTPKALAGVVERDGLLVARGATGEDDEEGERSHDGLHSV